MTDNSDQNKTVSPVVTQSKFGRVLSAFLNSPFAGMTPWIVMGFINGPGRFEEAAAVAFGLSLLIVIGGHKRGSKIKFLEVFDLVYFSSMVLLAQFAAASVLDWLEMWGGEMTNIALVSFALGSILIRQPFTMQYAKESEPEEMWDNPVFIHINYMITWSWVLGFGVGAVAGFYGDAVLQDNNNFWTGWIIGLAGTIFAISFTEFYPEYAVAKAMAKGGEDVVPQSLARLWDWVPIFVIVTGVAGLVTDSTSTVLGIVIIVVGIVIKVAMNALVPDKKKTQSQTQGLSPEHQ
ncbi:hypothetical protein [Williamsia muralis]|uniref:hypothetical protein n=1 Tax=Williamsia marianensis TaxID=85044 RepID=UPI0038259E02